jgi:hypothetical protein
MNKVERMIGGLGRGHFTIQRIMISKDESPDVAIDMASHILNKKVKGKVVGNFYHFRAMPKTHFKKGTFRTKQIKKGLKLVFGELLDEHKHLVGAGLFDYFKRGYDYLKEKVTPVVDKVKEKVSDVVDTVKEKVSSTLSINDYSKNTKKNLEKFGSENVVALTVYRKPIENWINTVFQGVSVGSWESLKKKYGMDKFFHLTLVCTLESGKKIAVEKLEVVSVNENIPSGEGVETLEVSTKGKSFTISSMLEKVRAKVGDKTFFSYDSLRGNNCQNFVAELLESQGLYDKEEKDFVYQDIKSLVQELPQHLLTFQRGVTDLGALFNKATGIGGKKDKLKELENRIKQLEKDHQKLGLSGQGVPLENFMYKDSFDIKKVQPKYRANLENRDKYRRDRKKSKRDDSDSDSDIEMPDFYELYPPNMRGNGADYMPISDEEKIASYREQMRGTSQATRAHYAEMIRRLEEKMRGSGMYDFRYISPYYREQMQGSGLFDFLMSPFNKHKLNN